MPEEITRDRRAFIKNVLGGTIAGSLLLVIPVSAGQLLQELPGEDDATAVFARGRFAFVVDIAACIGCGSCCVADKAEYRVPDGRYRTWVERYTVDDRDTVYVEAQNGGIDGSTRPRLTLPHPVRDTFFVPKLCNMCEEPACVEACPVGATYRTSDGFILIDETRCVGCAECVRACSYSARFINPRTKTAEKCTWCYHRVQRGLLPACVSVCPTGARKFGDLADRNSEVWKMVHGSRPVAVLKSDMGQRPRLLYVNLQKEVV
jgi:Fe-S-cluster-containing dehydrogenase component